MLDKIFKSFFTEKKQNKKTACITLIRESSLFNDNYLIEKRQAVKESSHTCLFEYFRGMKGLNLKERERANLCIHK